METIYEGTISTINKDQEEKVKHIAQNYSITSASQDKLDLQHTNHNKWASIKRGYKLAHTAKDTTTGKNESENYEEHCKIGMQKAQNTRNWR